MEWSLLNALYRIHSKSNNEGQMVKFICNYVNKLDKSIDVSVDMANNIYITKGKSDTYPCLAAHMDQVQAYHPKDFQVIETKHSIYGWSPTDKKRCGLGADDKNGIWIALQCLAKFPYLKIAFFTGEEIGCTGSNVANMDFFEDCRFVLQCDRRNHGDLITEIGCLELCSPEFIQAIQPEKYGYKSAYGLMTDVETLKGRGLKVSAVNMSCGYYDPHTDNEYTKKEDLLKCLKFVEHIIKDCTDVYSHEPSYSRYDDYFFYGRGRNYQSLWDDCNEDDSIFFTDAYYSAVEELEMYPSLTFNEFIHSCYDVNKISDKYELLIKAWNLALDDVFYEVPTSNT